ncbi:hypothetical protein F7725_022269 [Dissostichus mawsoni]|uniref:Uncharacterized protein n=1 Tax=Dissostichus mawsoni TaxID=36200 RepID=A0A7J5YX89_DISMA|nr:hypothetical protein F7725_022269 [Dissostichus mawsoni]
MNPADSATEPPTQDVMLQRHEQQLTFMAEAMQAMAARTEEETLTLIKVRVENDNLFTGRRHTAKKAWELHLLLQQTLLIADQLETSLVSLREILKALGLCGSVTPTQIGKKWDNHKRK